MADSNGRSQPDLPTSSASGGHNTSSSGILRSDSDTGTHSDTSLIQESQLTPPAGQLVVFLYRRPRPAHHWAPVTVYICRRPVVRSRADNATTDKAYLPWRYHNSTQCLLTITGTCWNCNRRADVDDLEGGGTLLDTGQICHLPLIPLEGRHPETPCLLVSLAAIWSPGNPGASMSLGCSSAGQGRQNFAY